MNPFEIFKKMYEDDIKNGTANLGVCPHFVEANKTKQGGVVGMGVPGEEIINIMNDKTIPILIMVNKEEWEKLKNI